VRGSSVQNRSRAGSRESVRTVRPDAGSVWGVGVGWGVLPFMVIECMFCRMRWRPPEVVAWGNLCAGVALR